MFKYSKFFAWVKFENCPNDEINKYLKTLNFLKSEDVYPLYIYLLAELYESNIVELTKIFKLLSDFMLRYRIVAPSGGGGSLRAIVHQLLEGLSSSVINLTYDDILFELSNSATPSGRYPNDDEFKSVLKESVNTNYARVALLKIEEYKRKNIPIPLDKVTVEHLMPQTLNNWWISNLGGKEEAERIYETYLNCIGNLAPISQGYNSANSNKSWLEKVKHLKNVQFIITSQIANCNNWKETDILQRNDDISNQACEATISPLERTRKYQTKNSSSEFEPGIYPISDISTSMNGVKPNTILYEAEIINVTAWKEFFCKICERAYNFDKTLFEKMVLQNNIHKATSNKNYPDKDPIISKDTSKLVSANPVGSTGYFSEGAISSTRARFYAKQVLDIYGLSDKFSVVVGDE